MKDLLSKNEGKLTILQIIGFLIMLSGIIGIMIAAFLPTIDPPAVTQIIADVPKINSVPSVVAVSFFVTMLGFAFAFPSLLEGNKGLSTMRMVVFMMTNVICMLLLKIGWASDSLTDIGLNSYWMGVIAFVFGAKATQSFFESRMAEPDTQQGGKGQEITNDEVIKIAIKQFPFKHQPGIVGVGRGFREDGQREVCLQINVNDEKYTQEYSKPLEVDLGNGRTQTITPKVVFVGNSQTHNGTAGDGVINVGGLNGNGTLGCVVKHNKTKKKYLLSCQHVFNHDYKYDTISEPTSIAFARDQKKIIGNHYSGFRTAEIDAALAEVVTLDGIDNSGIGKIKGPRDLVNSDTHETLKVKLVGYDESGSDPVLVEGLVVGSEFYVLLKYEDGTMFALDNLIVLSKKVDDSYHTISKPGYSGALVVDEKGYAIGLLVGGDNNYSYAIPINKILTCFDCSIV